MPSCAPFSSDAIVAEIQDWSSLHLHLSWRALFDFPFVISTSSISRGQLSKCLISHWTSSTTWTLPTSRSQDPKVLPKSSLPGKSDKLPSFPQNPRLCRQHQLQDHLPAPRSTPLDLVTLPATKIRPELRTSLRKRKAPSERAFRLRRIFPNSRTPNQKTLPTSVNLRSTERDRLQYLSKWQRVGC